MAGGSIRNLSFSLACLGFSIAATSMAVQSYIDLAGNKPLNVEELLKEGAKQNACLTMVRTKKLDMFDLLCANVEFTAEQWSKIEMEAANGKKL